MQYFRSIYAEKSLLTIFNYTLPYPIVKGMHPIFSSLRGTKNLPILPASALLFHAVNHIISVPNRLCPIQEGRICITTVSMKI